MKRSLDITLAVDGLRKGVSRKACCCKERKEAWSEGYLSRLSGNRGRKRGPEHMMGGEEPGTGAYNGVGGGGGEETRVYGGGRGEEAGTSMYDGGGGRRRGLECMREWGEEDLEGI